MAMGLLNILKSFSSASNAQQVTIEIINPPQHVNPSNGPVPITIAVTNNTAQPVTIDQISLSLKKANDNMHDVNTMEEGNMVGTPEGYAIQPGQRQEVILNLPIQIGANIADALSNADPRLGQYKDQITKGINMLDKFSRIAGEKGRPNTNFEMIAEATINESGKHIYSSRGIQVFTVGGKFGLGL